MKALSLWQPHAQAIALGLKPWETRDWPTRYRGPLAIHASKHLWEETGEWHDDARRQLQRRVEQTGQFGLSYGAVVCVVDVIDCVRTSLLRDVLPPEELFWGDFSDGEHRLGRYAFRLSNVRVLPKPVPARGMQGFFEVEIPGLSGDTGTLSLFGEGTC